MQTPFARKEDHAQGRRWFHVDASGKVLGRLSTRIATVLMGKDRPEYTPNVDTGACVVVTNAEKVRLTGNKGRDRLYRRYSGYPGGLTETSVDEMLRRHPDDVIRESVRRMLPKNKLGTAMLRKLKVYAGPRHPHAGHSPAELDV